MRKGVAILVKNLADDTSTGSRGESDSDRIIGVL